MDTPGYVCEDCGHCAMAPEPHECRPVYDLAYHHNNPKSRHRHTWRCRPLPWRSKARQFLRCLKVELDIIRKEGGL